MAAVADPIASAASRPGRTLVAEAMHAGVVSCSPHVSLAVAARIMAAHRIHSVVVVDPAAGETAATVWGVVSDLDVLDAFADGRLHERTAGETASAPPLLVTPLDALDHAVELMRERRATHLVVVDGLLGRPVGVLSSLDVAELLSHHA